MIGGDFSICLTKIPEVSMVQVHQVTSLMWQQDKECICEENTMAGLGYVSEWPHSPMLYL